MSNSSGTRSLSILGSTGSVGQSTADIVRHHRNAFTIDALVGNRNVAQLAADAREFNAKLAVTADDSLLGDLQDALDGSGIEVAAGENAVIEAAARPVDMVMGAIVGASGLKPTLAAVEQGTTIALANKECLVSGAEVFTRAAAQHKATVIPVDSEHSALFQCFEEHNTDGVDRLTLTASGGPFRTWSMEQLETATLQSALKHPNWSMGQKITIDSSTLMNKGLEFIEAFHLFPVALEKIDVVVHPQSIIHSYVSYVDGSVIAQLGMPDMRTPIAYAMAHPARISAPVDRLDLAQIGNLTFEPVGNDRFPAIDLARSALARGGNATTILNAANEIAVAAFLQENLRFLDITRLVADTIDQAERENMIVSMSSLDDVWQADSYARSKAGELASRLHT
ncbi:MAG: 1-deoxy-D-xylulose-5-phosphate reductoisomerase [Pseudomonadota bacterium]